MSLAHVRPYFIARGVELKWSQWKDAFNFQNIPATLMHNSFHIQMGSTQGVKQDQMDVVTTVPVTVRHFCKAFQNLQHGLDLSAAAADSYIQKALKASNRLTGVGIKNVSLNNIQWVPYDQSNDNVIVTQMDFSALVIIQVDET